jgi:hypothetical protein
VLSGSQALSGRHVDTLRTTDKCSIVVVESAPTVEVTSAAETGSADDPPLVASALLAIKQCGGLPPKPHEAREWLTREEFAATLAAAGHSRRHSDRDSVSDGLVARALVVTTLGPRRTGLCAVPRRGSRRLAAALIDLRTRRERCGLFPIASPSDP